jgi:hypothetical protein
MEIDQNDSARKGAALAPEGRGIQTTTFGSFLRQWEAKQPTLPGIAPARQPAPLNRAPYDGHLRVGDHVECNSRNGVFRPCSCGSSRFAVEAAQGRILRNSDAIGAVLGVGG